ncbi:phosphoglycolate phosphatase [Sphingomonas sp. Leaf17]|uniref:HAD-IA family hydrolase n=1 Tax=Sphingomonas sp. Leaf17 TaxID=1735683 RepID=UPI0006F33A6A|nr:HAD-IA family hydrolase [Sphingomonas sp. Leaf17]KQM65612.1 phosphoglycolate phosphatase [Sphingomonas sp. Leaf17]
MTHFSFDIVGFDLDGTLLDTSGDLAAAVNHALGTIGRAPLPVAQIRPMIGGGARHMLAQGMAATGGGDDAQIDVLHQRLLSYYEANISVHTRPFPGAIEAVGALRARGVRVGIMTNKIEKFARAVLGDLGLTDHFDCIIGGDTLGPGTSKPSPVAIEALVERLGGGRAAYVGDTIYDVKGARAAGLPCVVVSFGFRTQPAEDLGADRVIDDYADLISALETL